jgi:hypothetical protein
LENHLFRDRVPILMPRTGRAPVAHRPFRPASPLTARGPARIHQPLNGTTAVVSTVRVNKAIITFRAIDANRLFKIEIISLKSKQQ